MDSAAFWNKAAAKYADSKIANIPAYETTRDLTRAYLKPRDVILELGAGTGMTARYLADTVQSVTAADISDEMTKISSRLAEKENIPNLTAITAPVMSDQFKKNSFDVVLAFNLLHLLPDRDRHLAAIHSYLKPGGLFISKTVCLPQGWRGLGFRLMLTAIPLMQALGKAPYVKIPTITTLEEEIEKSGFQMIESGNYPENPPRRFLVAKKA